MSVSFCQLLINFKYQSSNLLTSDVIRPGRNQSFLKRPDPIKKSFVRDPCFTNLFSCSLSLLLSLVLFEAEAGSLSLLCSVSQSIAKFVFYDSDWALEKKSIHVKRVHSVRRLLFWRFSLFLLDFIFYSRLLNIQNLPFLFLCFDTSIK